MRISLPAGLTPARLGPVDAEGQCGAGACGTVDCCHERESQTHLWEAPTGGTQGPCERGATRPHLTTEHARPGPANGRAPFSRVRLRIRRPGDSQASLDDMRQRAALVAGWLHPRPSSSLAGHGATAPVGVKQPRSARHIRTSPRPAFVFGRASRRRSLRPPFARRAGRPARSLAAAASVGVLVATCGLYVGAPDETCFGDGTVLRGGADGSLAVRALVATGVHPYGRCASEATRSAPVTEGQALQATT